MEVHLSTRHGEFAAADVDRAAKALAAAEYDRDLFIKNRELRRLLSADEYNAELVSLTQTVSEARIAYERTQTTTSDAPSIEVFNDVWDEWSDASRRECLNRFLSAIILKSANKRRIPVANRLAIHMAPGNTFGTDRWLLPGGEWSREAYGDPDRLSPRGRHVQACLRRGSA